MPNARVLAVGGAMSAPTVILEFTPVMRGLIETVIEDLILLLDEIDGDEDLEPADDLEDNFDLENDPAEVGLADGDALALFTQIESAQGLDFDFSGYDVARRLLARVRR